MRQVITVSSQIGRINPVLTRWVVFYDGNIAATVIRAFATSKINLKSTGRNRIAVGDIIKTNAARIGIAKVVVGGCKSPVVGLS